MKANEIKKKQLSNKRITTATKQETNNHTYTNKNELKNKY